MIAGLAHAGAVAKRELRVSSRGRALFVARTACALLVTLPCLASVGGASLIGRLSPAVAAELGAALHARVAISTVLFGAAIAALLGVLSVRAERLEETLGLLVLSGMRPREIVAGKAVAIVGLVGLAEAAVLPIVAIAGWGGGIDHAWLVPLAAVAFLFTLTGAACGLFAGFSARGLAGGVLCACLLLYGIFVFPETSGLLPFLLEMVSPLRREMPGYIPGQNLYAIGGGCFSIGTVFAPWPLGATSALLSVAFQGLAGPVSLASPLVLLALLSVLLFAAASLSVERAASRRSAFGLRRFFEGVDRFFERVNVGKIVVGRRAARPRGGSAAVSWLTRTSGGLGLTRYVVRAGLVVFVASAIPTLMSFQGLGRDLAEALLLASAFAAVLAAAFLGAASVGAERQRKTFSTLLVTPFSAGEIVLGKLRASLRVILVPAAAAMLLLPWVTVEIPDAITASSTLYVAHLAAIAFSVSLVTALRVRSSFRAALVGLVATGLFAFLEDPLVPERPRFVLVLTLFAAALAAPFFTFDRLAGRAA